VLVPKLVTTLKDYSRRQLLADVSAGVIVGIVALPLAIAFAIASGVPPQAGLATAIVAGLIISALGGSRVQIGGPTGAFIVIVYGIVQQHGYQGLALATMLAGLMLIGIGVARLGGVIKFIPYPVTIGFTSGIAVIIFWSQIRDLRDPWAVGTAAATLLILVFWPKVSRKIPAPFVALIGVTVAVRALGLDVETIGSRFGAIPSGLPRPSLPFDLAMLSPATLGPLVQPAFTIALLAAIESLLSAVVADGMIGGRHRSNMELVAQGVANIASPLFGGIPATGAIARTATNVKQGGRTPVAGIVHAVTLLLITLFFGRWVVHIPLAVLAAILVMVAYHMSEWRVFKAELTGAPRSDVLVMLTTFLLTVLVDLTVALEVGMVLAAFLFMKRMAEVTNVSAISREMGDDEADPENDAAWRRTIPAGVQVYEINGPFFFGAAETFRNAVGTVGAQPKVIIIRLRSVPAIDSTGMHALRDLYRRYSGQGTVMLLAEVHAQPLVAMERSGLLQEIGGDGMFGTLEAALERAAAISGG
jgi:SulP family sulfate permease